MQLHCQMATLLVSCLTFVYRCRCCSVCCSTLQFWVYTLFAAMREGEAGIKAIPSTKLAAESSRQQGRFTCIPNKIKF